MSDYYLTPTQHFFHLYHSDNKLICNEIRSVLYQHASLHFYSACSLKQQSTDRPRSNTLFWFRANQSVLFLLNVACLSEKQQILILLSFVSHDRDSNSQYIAREAIMITVTPANRLHKPQLYFKSQWNIKYKLNSCTFQENSSVNWELCNPFLFLAQCTCNR